MNDSDNNATEPVPGRSNSCGCYLPVDFIQRWMSTVQFFVNMFVIVIYIIS